MRDAQFKRPRSANVGIGGCASPQPNFDCKIGEKARLAGFERLRHPALSDHVVFSGSVEAGDREADRSRGRKRRHSFGYRSARSAACVGRCYQRQSRTGRHESRQAYGGYIDCRNPKPDVSFAVSGFDLTCRSRSKRSRSTGQIAFQKLFLSQRWKAGSPPRFGDWQKNGRLDIDGHGKTPDRECGIQIEQAARFVRCFLDPAKP